MVGNTYPGWRSDIPLNFFHQYYRPKSALINVLPYDHTNPPKVVVHLRSPDGNEDNYRGLDEESLQHLGQFIPGNGTYLVTNRPDWYRRFHNCCGWSYDKQWIDKPIHHGGMNITWFANGTKILRKKNSASAGNQNLKLWSDWYTMLNADKLYHSPSDFSRSACHWNAHCSGYELHGMRTVLQQNRTARIGSHLDPIQFRELNLLPAGYDAVKTRIPALVERQEPDSMRNDDNCVFLRFCIGKGSAQSKN